MIGAGAAGGDAAAARGGAAAGYWNGRGEVGSGRSRKLDPRRDPD